MSDQQDIRWEQRFQNFSRAFHLLRDALSEERELSQLEKEGVIQRFEYTFELAWKTLKDRLNYDGLELDKISPKSVIRTAHKHKYLNDPETWFLMVGDRNLMSHTYDFATFETVIDSIKSNYLLCLEELHSSFSNDLQNHAS